MENLDREVVFDASQLMQIMPAIQNRATGLGTRQDKTQAVEFNFRPRIQKGLADALFEASGMLGRLVETYPQDCSHDWMKIKPIIEDKQKAEEFNEMVLLKYLQDLKFGIGKIGVIEAFKEASIAARKYGDGFVVLGIADGQSPDQPVKENSIQSIEWLMVLEQDEVVPQLETIRDDKPNYYQIHGKDLETIWHRSRILHFKGKKLSGTSLQRNGGRSNSVYQTVIEAWSAWRQGNMASSAMLADYNQAVHKMRTLKQAVEDDARSGTNINQTAIKSRLDLMEYCRSVMNAILIDGDDEDFEYVSRSYQGARDIMDGLEETLVAEVDLPEYKLFNKTNRTGALSTQQTAGLAQRYDWTQTKNSWMKNNWIENYEHLVRYAILATNSAINERVEVYCLPNAKVVLTPKELIELQNEAADRDDKNINNGIYGPKSAQSAYLNPEYDGQITIAPEEIIEDVNDVDEQQQDN